MLTTITRHLTAGEGLRSGEPLPGAPALSYDLRLEDVTVVGESRGRPALQIDCLRLRIGSDAAGDGELATALRLRSGDTALVGTLSLRRQTVLVVLAARVR